MHRRDLFKVIGVAGLAPDLTAQGHHRRPESQSLEVDQLRTYKPRFFSQFEYQTIEAMCEILLPADTDSPGAKEAGVAFYLDTTLLHAPDKLKQIWKAGIADVDRASLQTFHQAFSLLSVVKQETMFGAFFADEESVNPANPDFFSRFKRMAIEGFCYSELGMRDYLKYRGETAIPFFPGCKST